MDETFKKRKLVFIGNSAAPYMVKFCYELQNYFDAEFLFYEYMTNTRPAYWKIPLGDKCKIIENVFFVKTKKYFSLSIFKYLKRYDPEVIVLGGFTIPSNYMVYLWARKHKRKVCVISEEPRDKSGITRKSVLLKLFIGQLYKNIDMIFGAGEHGVNYFKNNIGFPKDRVVFFSYPVDMEKHLTHPIRKIGDCLNILFPHRLVDIYNPLFALEIFSSFSQTHTNSHLYLNSSGELLDACIEEAKKMGIKNKVHFLSEINKWDDLPDIYKNCQICLSTAKYSNGNISLLEAMASGMGLIISDKIKFNSDLIIENESGFVCELTMSTFTSALEAYFNDESLLEKHGRINKLVAKRFSVQNTTDDFCKKLNTIF